MRVGEIMRKLNITDPGFPQQWHLFNTEQPGNDLNVTGVWAQGITGINSTVCFVDDGLDYESEDLAQNFFAEGSWDYNDHVALPKPRLLDDRHGTRCAGEVAAVRNNVCGVGVAYGAKVSGVRILSGDLTEADEAASINYRMDVNHIYSCSWGPADDGEHMEAPPQIVKDAVLNGVTKGRGGLGSIYVFASGNGGAKSDNCNFDGYTNSIYTITVGSIDRNDNHPVYSESCSAMMITMYSSGYGGQAIYTTDWPGQCTNQHGGTSAAAPLASGIYTLVLQVRPDLTWRDFQHLTVRTAVTISPKDDSWQTTAAGRKYSHKFGYGKLDGWAIVEAAKTYQKVNPQTHFISPSVIVNDTIPTDSEGITSHVIISEENLKDVDLKRLEHITVTVDIDHQRRGDVEIRLTSPSNVVSYLAMGRGSDKDKDGFKDWVFMSVAHWDENPLGIWLLTVITVIDKERPQTTGFWNNWKLTLWGESGNTTVGGGTTIAGTETATAPTVSLTTTTTTTTTTSTSTTTTTTTTATTKTSTPTQTSSTSSFSATASAATTETPTPSPTTNHALLAFGFFGAVGAVGAVFLYKARRKSVSAQAYEFQTLNEREVEAAFDYEDDEDDEEKGFLDSRAPMGSDGVG
ncbi:pheromone processing endoprotease, partial [Rhizophlyctis rosea]